MRILTIVHEDDAGPGVFAEVLAEASVEIDTWHAAHERRPPARPGDYGAVVSFGGSMHPDQHDTHPWLATETRFLAEALRERVPLLGVCLGAQLLAEAAGAGGGTSRMSGAEIGWYDVSLTAAGAADPVIGPIGESFPALGWHSYEVVLPQGAIALASGERCVQAYRIDAHAWGIQFHAEVTAEDFQHWLDSYGDDADAVAVGIDPDALAAQTEQLIEPWNHLGRGICERFVRVAEAR